MNLEDLRKKAREAKEALLYGDDSREDLLIISDYVSEFADAVLELIEKLAIATEALSGYATYPNEVLYFDIDNPIDPKKIIRIPIAEHAREALQKIEGKE